MNAAVLLLLCATALLSSHRGASARSGVEKRNNRYCGNNLNRVLEFLCEEYYDPTQKRHTGYRPAHDVPATLPVWFPVLDANGDSKMGFMEAKAALQLLRPSVRYGRQTRGIVEECCHKSCSTLELLAYCKTPRNNADLQVSSDDNTA